MSTRKIRMTQAGLVAMPVRYDEALITADDMAHDQQLCTAWAELQEHVARAGNKGEANEAAWNAALTAAVDNDLAALREALTRASHAARAAGVESDHEDAALAMLPEDA